MLSKCLRIFGKFKVPRIYKARVTRTVQIFMIFKVDLSLLYLVDETNFYLNSISLITLVKNMKFH